MSEKILGVIGGLGPLATAHFLELVVSMTQAETEQDNMDMIVYNFPSIPDRTGYILGCNLKSPLPGMLSVGRALARQGADYVAIPCITAHYFYRELEAGIPVPIINCVAELVRQLQQAGIRKAGIMATDGTIRSRILARELEQAGIQPLVPSPQHQQDVTHLIYQNVKAGKPVEMDRFLRVRDALWGQGAEVIVLGCTELSLIKREHPIGHGFLDAMEVLAQQSILCCGKTLKPQFRDLLT